LPKRERDPNRVNSQTSKTRIPLLPPGSILVARLLVSRTRGRTIPWSSASWRTSRTGAHRRGPPTAPLQTPTHQQRRWHDDGRTRRSRRLARDCRLCARGHRGQRPSRAQAPTTPPSVAGPEHVRAGGMTTTDVKELIVLLDVAGDVLEPWHGGGG